MGRVGLAVAVGAVIIGVAVAIIRVIPSPSAAPPPTEAAAVPKAITIAAVFKTVVTGAEVRATELAAAMNPTKAAGAEHAAVEAATAEPTAMETAAKATAMETAAKAAAMEPAAKAATVTTTKAATVTTTKAATAPMTATTAPATTAREGGTWLRKYQDARESSDRNAYAACDTNASHADPLLSIATGLAVLIRRGDVGADDGARLRPRMKSSLISSGEASFPSQLGIARAEPPRKPLKKNDWTVAAKRASMRQA